MTTIFRFENTKIDVMTLENKLRKIFKSKNGTLELTGNDSLEFSDKKKKYCGIAFNYINCEFNEVFVEDIHIY